MATTCRFAITATRPMLRVSSARRECRLRTSRIPPCPKSSRREMRRGWARRFRRSGDPISEERIPRNGPLREGQAQDESAFDRQHPGSQLCSGRGQSNDGHYGPVADSAETLAGPNSLAGIGSDSTRILAHFGLSRQAIEAAGGRIGNAPEDRENFDVAIGGGGPMTTAPEWRIWTEISQKFDLNFIELPDDLLADLAREGQQDRGMIPAGLYRGIERPIPTVVRTGTAIYGRADMPDSFAYDVAKAMDEQQQLLEGRPLNFSYNVHTVWNGFEVPLHPGAARYYKEKRYMK